VLVAQINKIAGENADNMPKVTAEDPSATIFTTFNTGNNDVDEEKDRVSQEVDEKMTPRISFVFEFCICQMICI
jgi:hypothetical protein